MEVKTYSNYVLMLSKALKEPNYTVEYITNKEGYKNLIDFMREYQISICVNHVLNKIEFENGSVIAVNIISDFEEKKVDRDVEQEELVMKLTEDLFIQACKLTTQRSEFTHDISDIAFHVRALQSILYARKAIRLTKNKKDGGDLNSTTSKTKNDGPLTDGHERY